MISYWDDFLRFDRMTQMLLVVGWMTLGMDAIAIIFLLSEKLF